MKLTTGMFFLIFLLILQGSYASLKGKQNNVPFARALPEDISNKNFPDVIENFDYPNVSLLELTEAIGKLTGLNFIIDPGLSGKKVKIIAPSKITVAEAYKAFLSALAANDYTLVKKDAFWKITPTVKALKDNIEIYSGDYFPNTDQLITRILKLQHINAKEFSDSIKYLLSQQNAISYHEETNSIIVSDYGSVIEKIMKLAQKMDLPGSKEQIRIILVRHADAGDLGGILNQLIFNKSRKTSTAFNKRRSSRSKLPPTLSSQSKKREGNVKISTILPDDRTNSLIVSANEAGFKKVTELVKKLDTYVDPARNGGIYVYKVLYGTVEQIYNTLTGLGSKTPSASKKSTTQKRRSFNRPFSSFSGGKSSSSPLFENVTLMADSHTNSLIISARNRYDFERVKAVLKKIDIPKDQVFVQAIIVEMAVTKGDQWEVNLAGAITSWVSEYSWFKDIFPPGKDGAASLVPIAGFLNRSFDIQSLAKGTKFGPGLMVGVSVGSLLKHFGADLATSYDVSTLLEGVPKDDRADVAKSIARSNNQISNLAHSSMFPLLQILKKAGNFNILSTPQLTALDNVKAFIEVGENAPVGLTSTGNTGSIAVQNSTQRENVTIKLEITPSINADSGTVQMEIKQKFDDFSARLSTASELRERGVHLLKREIETTLVLNDGEIAVLGGLMVEKEIKDENKIPILGDIPILGWLFKGSTVEKQKNNLLVFIKPTIIRGKHQREDTQKLLGKKLEERIHFVKKHMKGRDPHGNFLKKLQEQKSLDEIAPIETQESDILIPPYPQENLKREEEALPLIEDTEIEEPSAEITLPSEEDLSDDIPEDTEENENITTDVMKETSDNIKKNENPLVNEEIKQVVEEIKNSEKIEDEREDEEEEEDDEDEEDEIEEEEDTLFPKNSADKEKKDNTLLKEQEKPEALKTPPFSDVLPVEDNTNFLE